MRPRLPLVREQSKEVLILETVAEVEAFAQRTLIGDAMFEQKALGARVRVVDDRFHAIQPQLCEAEAQDGGHRLCHDALSPRGPLELIAGFRAMEAIVEPVEAAR